MKKNSHEHRDKDRRFRNYMVEASREMQVQMAVLKENQNVLRLIADGFSPTDESQKVLFAAVSRSAALYLLADIIHRKIDINHSLNVEPDRRHRP